MDKANPEMIVLARELKGITQLELAEAIGVMQSTISRYESGLIEVPQEHLVAIAKFLHRPISFFYWREQLYGASCMYHRKNRRLSVAELRMIHAKVNLLRIQATRLLKQPRIESTYSFHRLDSNKFGGPEGCARQLRQLWQLPTGPIRNVVRTIERAGGMVFRCPFGMSRVDGISQWALDDAKMPPVFFVHEEIPGDRERLTLSHEIGHIVMHHLPTENDPEEEANRFAGEFLMPGDEIGPDLHNLTLAKAAAMKCYWRVSMQAIIVRARHLERISENQYEYLFRQLSAKGYRKCEPMLIPVEEPEMFSDLLEFHKKNLHRGARDISELMGELEDEFQAIYGNNLSNFRLVS